MARGWESKDIESRQELAEESARQREAAARVSPVDLQRESLLLTRRRVETDLTRATHPRHRAQLEAALAHLDAELAKLQ